jgi:hypothetical protein
LTEDTEKKHENLSKDSRTLDRDLNPGPLEYKAGVFISHSTMSFGHGFKRRKKGEKETIKVRK